MIIFNLICLPNNDYRYILDQIYEKNNNIKVVHINLVEIFFSKSNLKKYERDSKHDLKKEIRFKTKKSFKKYIIKNFINKILTVSLVFFSLIIILSILEEISFFKNINVNFLTPYFLVILSAVN